MVSPRGEAYKLDRMRIWIRPFHEYAGAHLLSLPHPNGSIPPADPKRFVLRAWNRRVVFDRSMLTLPTASDNRRGVPPPPDHNFVGLDRIIPVFRENQVRIIATFNLELNVFLLSNKGVEVVYVMIFVHRWQVNVEAGGCDVKQGKSRSNGAFQLALPESPE